MIKDYLNKINILIKKYGDNKVTLYDIKKLNNKFIIILKKNKNIYHVGGTPENDIKSVTDNLVEYTRILNDINEKLKQIKKKGDNDEIIDEIMRQLEEMLKQFKRLVDY